MLFDDVDLLFVDFLCVGVVWIVFFVCFGFEVVVVYYFEMGEIWNGGLVFDVNDLLYVLIIKEI